MSVNCEKIEDVLGLLNNIDQNNIKGMVLYALFQKYVMEDDFGAMESFLAVKRQEEAHNIGKKYWDESDNKYGADSNTAVIILSGNRQNIGTIVNANHEIGQILGYHKNELVGENISAIMPEIMGIHHNVYLESYFERHNRSNTNEVSEQIVFPQHAKGYIVPCMRLVRLVPNLDNGVQFLGFVALAKDLSILRPDDVKVTNDELLLILLDEHYNVLGFNLNLGVYCCGGDDNTANYNRYLENEQKVDLSKLYPEIFAGENEQIMRTPEGLSTFMDMKIIKKALNSEIVDTYETSEAGSEAHGDKTPKSQLISCDKVASLGKLMAQCNIKMKDFMHPSKLGKFTICTIYITDHTRANLVELRADSDRDLKENLEERDKLAQRIFI